MSLPTFVECRQVCVDTQLTLDKNNPKCRYWGHVLYVWMGRWELSLAAKALWGTHILPHSNSWKVRIKITVLTLWSPDSGIQNPSRHRTYCVTLPYLSHHQLLHFQNLQGVHILLKGVIVGDSWIIYQRPVNTLNTLWLILFLLLPLTMTLEVLL